MTQNITIPADKFAKVFTSRLNFLAKLIRSQPTSDAAYDLLQQASYITFMCLDLLEAAGAETYESAADVYDALEISDIKIDRAYMSCLRRLRRQRNSKEKTA